MCMGGQRGRKARFGDKEKQRWSWAWISIDKCTVN